MLSFRRLSKDILIYGLGDMVLKATAFFTLPVYTRLFTPADYGIWNFVTTAVGFFGGILVLGGDSAYARFFFEAKTQPERQVITSTWFGFLALWSAGVVAIVLPFSGLYSFWSFGNRQQALLYTFALLAAPLTLINAMCGQALRNQFQASRFAILNVVSTLLSIGLSVAGALLWGLPGTLGGALAGAVLILPVRVWTVRDLLRPAFSLPMLRKLLAYGVPLVPSSLAYWIFAVSDRLLLGKLSTLEQVGLYAIANSLTSVLAFANSALGQAWTPYAIKTYEEQSDSAVTSYGRMMTYILAGFGFLAVGFTAFSHEALVVLSTPPFYPAAFAVGPLALGFVAYASTQVTAMGIMLTKKTHYFAVFSWLAALLNLGINLWLIPRWGMMAASWTTLAAYVFLTLAYLAVSQRLVRIAYEKKRAFIILALTVGFVLAVALFPDLPLIWSGLLKGVYCLAFVGALFLFRALGQREWRPFLTWVQGLRARSHLAEAK